MTDHDTATGEGMPEPPEPEPSATVVLRLSGPAFTTSFTCETADGGTLVVTLHGVEVPVEQAEALIDLAAKSGVTLTRSTT